MDARTLVVDTPLMVSEDGKFWLRRYFSHASMSLIKSEYNVFTFPMGCTSWSAKNFKGNGMNPRCSYWPYWRIPNEEEL